jgi:hypothetical protein
VTTFAKGDKDNLKLRLGDLVSKLAIVDSRCNELETNQNEIYILVADLAGDVAILKRSASESGSDISTDCEDGFWKDTTATTSEGVCKACSAVEHAQAEATHICTSATTTRVSACATNFCKHTAGDADVCVYDCADGFWEDDTGGTSVCTACNAITGQHASSPGITCSAADNSVVKSCAPGYHLDENKTSALSALPVRNVSVNPQLLNSVALENGVLPEPQRARTATPSTMLHLMTSSPAPLHLTPESRGHLGRLDRDFHKPKLLPSNRVWLRTTNLRGANLLFRQT